MYFFVQGKREGMSLWPFEPDTYSIRWEIKGRGLLFLFSFYIVYVDWEEHSTIRWTHSASRTSKHFKDFTLRARL